MNAKNAGLNQRRAIRAANRELKREGIPAKIGTPERTRSRTLALTDYIRDVNPALLRKLDLEKEESHHALIYIADVAATTDELREVEHGEKVDVIGFRNFTSDDFARCQREMMATMMRAPGIDPLEHFILSWQAHEQPTPDQIHRAAEIFLSVMGLGENQAIYAAHSNTANYPTVTPFSHTEQTRPVDPVEQHATYSIHGDFPFLHADVTEHAGGTAQFAGLDPAIDAWLEAHRRDPQNLSQLRPLASRIMQSERACLIRNEMEAEGFTEAQRISQQAIFHLRQLHQARQAGMQR